MITVDTYTKDRFSRAGASLCTCWRITRSDGEELGLTDHDNEIEFTGTVFRASSGGMGSALEATADLAPDNADIIGILDEVDLGTDAIEAGRYDDARVEVWRVDWEDPAARLLVKVGSIGNIERQGGGYRAEFRSIKHYLDQTTGRIYGRTCDAGLGDERCGVDLTASEYRVSATVAAEAVRDFSLDGAASVDSNWATGGAFIVEGGPLAGVVRSIRLHERTGSQVVVSLWEALPRPLPVGTSVTLVAGCDNQFSTCGGKFANSARFAGFPHIPGTDILTIYPSDGGRS
ncbi:MAG: DUF2163 domain-containing protein [Pseudomonadota bacterium]